jgi:DMSO/TMAO reductase YedYZ heme-binding membrane subunit
MNEMSSTEIMYQISDYINAYIWQGIPEVLKGFVIALIFVVLFRKQLKKHPIAFYIYPTVYFLWSVIYAVLVHLPNDFFEEKGLGDSWLVNIGWFFGELGLTTMLGIGLIIIVMFIGVLPKTAFVANLFAIRTEMSVIGATLLMGHGFARLGTALYYLKWEEFLEGYNYTHVFFGVFFLMYGILGPILVAILVLPWVTSFRTVRKKMSARAWKKLQTYLGVPLFIGMLVFGFVLNLSWSVGWNPDFANADEITAFRWAEDEPMSLEGGIGFAEWILSAKIYLVMLVSYSILRIKKIRNAKQRTEALSPETPEAITAA